MAKNLKLNIKNTQIAEAVNLSSLKEKLASRKAVSEEQASVEPEKSDLVVEAKSEAEERPKEEGKRVKARTRSMFAEPRTAAGAEEQLSTEGVDSATLSATAEPFSEKEEERRPRSKESSSLYSEKSPKRKSGEQLRKEIFGDTTEESVMPANSAANLFKEADAAAAAASEENKESIAVSHVPSKNEPVRSGRVKQEAPPLEEILPLPKATLDRLLAPKRYLKRSAPLAPAVAAAPIASEEAVVPRLGPTGRHMRDFLPPKPRVKEVVQPPPPPISEAKTAAAQPHAKEEEKKGRPSSQQGVKPRETTEAAAAGSEAAKKGGRQAKVPGKEFRDLKPSVKKQEHRSFDTRDKYGLRTSDEDQQWRKKKSHKHHIMPEDVTIRPTALKVRVPIALKDLAVEMKLKASQLLSKLLMQGIALTLNDQLNDETTIQLLGQEFGCDITIDTAEQERIRITDKTIQEEILQGGAEGLVTRAPVIAFMGHVDHGKTSLIDAIRKSNRVAGEAGAITQHIGAFRCSTAVGDIAILDTPGHEAFSAMRARGAHVTDLVVLVVAGDEGMRQQTLEAIQHAKAAGVTIVVAINKCDKPNFNAETVYRQLSEQELLPETWGGQTITVNCSAVTGEGIQTLLEMVALQAEVLEIQANVNMRARGTVLESEMHKGMGAVATILVQNGTLRHGDALVFESLWGRIKTMRDENGRELKEAGPSTPVSITGLSGLPDAGEEFIVVKNEKEAREIAVARQLDMQQARLLQKRKLSLESLFQQAPDQTRKVLNVVLRADVQGSLEALRTALEKIESAKVLLNIIFAGIGEVAESDVQLAAASRAIVMGYHTQVEGHAESLIKELGVQVRLHDIIYHAIDDIKELMAGTLDKVAQEEVKGRAVVRATFKSSQHGNITGCQVIEGTIHRSNKLRLIRQEAVIWQGDMSSLRRVKEDVREVQKGVECGILLNGYNDAKVDDIIEAYQITYHAQQL